MLCKLYSGCVPPPNDSYELPDLDLEEFNEVMLETSKVMAFIGKFAVAGKSSFDLESKCSTEMISQKPVFQFCTPIQPSFTQHV